MPTGLARWRDKLFITVPRWKRGVPSSLNYVYLNGSQQQELNPYPSWGDAFVSDDACCVSTNSSVVSAYRIHVDKCDRLWVVDNGVTDMFNNVKQITQPAILVFDLYKDTLKYKHVFSDDLLRDSTVFTSIVVDIVDEDCRNAYAYISDMGSGALVVYDLRSDTAWRRESPLFKYEANASVYRVGGIDFFWNDGVSSVALSQKNSCGTKLLKISTRLLRNSDIGPEEFHNGVQIVGDRGPMSQATACDYDPGTNVLFYTQLSKNGVGCWNLDREFSEQNTPLLLSDCSLLEFPNDIKVKDYLDTFIYINRIDTYVIEREVDSEGDVWLLSDRQSRFLYGRIEPSRVNFRVLRAPAARLVRATRCQLNALERAARMFKSIP
ncbi:unnamed protein product, partial [Iphiclides podalirius]